MYGSKLWTYKTRIVYLILSLQEQCIKFICIINSLDFSIQIRKKDSKVIETTKFKALDRATLIPIPTINFTRIPRH